jgi:hypothetical protein
MIFIISNDATAGMTIAAASSAAAAAIRGSAEVVIFRCEEHLYKSLRRSVGWLVGWSVGPSVRLSPRCNYVEN